MRDAKYYLTIEKQERQPHELPLQSEMLDANGLKTRHTRNQGFLSLLASKGKVSYNATPTRNQTWCLEFSLSDVRPCA